MNRSTPTMPTAMPTQGITKPKMIPITTSAMASPIIGPSVPATPRRKLALEDDEPLLGQFADGVGGALARVARLLDAAVGHLVGAEGRRLVDGDAAELQLLGRPQRGIQPAGEDPGLQAVPRRVRELDPLVERLDRGEGHHRP